MNINVTLFGQMLSFAVFVWFTMKFVWPPIVKAMEERKAKIAEGLAAAERGQHEQELAEKRAKEALHEAKRQAAEIKHNAEKQAALIVEEARDKAKEEGHRQMLAAQAEIEQETALVRSRFADPEARRDEGDREHVEGHEAAGDGAPQQGREGVGGPEHLPVACNESHVTRNSDTKHNHQRKDLHNNLGYGYIRHIKKQEHKRAYCPYCPDTDYGTQQLVGLHSEQARDNQENQQNVKYQHKNLTRFFRRVLQFFPVVRCVCSLFTRIVGASRVQSIFRCISRLCGRKTGSNAI